MAGTTTINQPKVTFNIQADVLSVSNTAHKVLIVGQQLAGGAAVSGELTEEIGNDGSENTLYGIKSQLAAMIRTFKGTAITPLNRVTRIDAIGLDDASGTAATGDVAFVGTATEAGILTVSVGSIKDHSYEISVVATDTATIIGDKLDVLVAADTTAQADSSNTTGTVTFTAQHDGTLGNVIGLKVVGAVAGVTHSVTAMASGATDPSLTTLFAPVSSLRYQTIIYPSNWGFSTLTSFTEPRFNVSGQLLDGIGITVLTDTFANLGTVADAENAKTLLIEGNNEVSETSYKGPAVFEMDYTAAAQIGALRALRLTDGTNIADITIGGGVIDNTGGPALSSKPYFNTPTSFPVIPGGKGFDDSAIESLEAKGISVFGNNIADNLVILGAVVTTFKTDSAGNPDPTFHFLNAVDTAITSREYFFNNVRAKYAQTRLTDGDLIPGVDSANEQSVRTFLIKLYNDLTKPEFSATRSGEVNLNIFKANLVFTEFSILTGSVAAEMVLPLVGQFRDFNGLIKVRF